MCAVGGGPLRYFCGERLEKLMKYQQFGIEPKRNLRVAEETSCMDIYKDTGALITILSSNKKARLEVIRSSAPCHSDLFLCVDIACTQAHKT